jgi:hypothetical protein
MDVRQLRRGYRFHDRFRNKRASLAFAKAARSADPKVAAEAHFWLGAVEEDLGDIDAARAAHNVVLDSGVPGYGPNAGVLLGKMMMEHGDLDAAQSALERTVAYRNRPLRPRPADPTQGVPRDSVNWPFHAAVGLEALAERRGDQEGAGRAKELSYELHESEELARIELNRGEQFSFFDYPEGVRGRMSEQYLPTILGGVRLLRTLWGACCESRVISKTRSQLMSAPSRSVIRRSPRRPKCTLR